MKLNKFRNLASVGLTALALALPGAANAGKSDYSQVYIFGDSLSDSGNIYALTGETAKAPYDLIPSAAYAIGGHQFSNGKTWASRFAQNLSLNKGGKAALDSPGKNGNYAFGGARSADNTPADPVPDAAVQVGLFLNDYAGVADSEALYVLAFGGNDLRDALVAAQQNQDPTPIIGAAIQATLDQIGVLYQSGARNFLVANPPNLANAPAVILLGPAAVGGANQLSGGYAQNLEGALQFYIDPLPGISVTRLDFFGLTNDIATNPGDFGVTNITDTCITPGVSSGALCSQPSKHAFWDGIHPTAVIHDAIADAATALFNPNW